MLASARSNKPTIGSISKVIEPYVGEIAGLVHMIRSNPSYELEARLVSQDTSTRWASIPKTEFLQILSFFKKNEKVFTKTSGNAWEQSIVSFFDESYLRNIRYVSSDKPTEWMMKTPLVDYDYSIANRPFGVRVSLREERKTTAPKVPSQVTFLRSRKRSSFWLASFRWDFSIVWSAKTSEELKHAKPGYEIELEYLPEAEEGEALTSQHIATDFLCRILELQGLESKCEVTRVQKESKHKKNFTVE